MPFTASEIRDSSLGWQVTIQDSSTRKSVLRNQMREHLRHIDQASTELLAELEVSLGALEESQSIAIFSALPGEPDITPLIETLPQHRWLLPRVDGDLLHFHQVRDMASELKPGAFGILEPDHSLPTTPKSGIDIFICPGLAFDSSGGRLGRGRGFYDRALAEANEHALKIGVGFACQLVDDTFPETHDILMHAVLCKG